jgi:hypothetical protein
MSDLAVTASGSRLRIWALVCEPCMPWRVVEVFDTWGRPVQVAANALSIDTADTRGIRSRSPSLRDDHSNNGWR